MVSHASHSEVRTSSTWTSSQVRATQGHHVTGANLRPWDCSCSGPRRHRLVDVHHILDRLIDILVFSLNDAFSKRNHRSALRARHRHVCSDTSGVICVPTGSRNHSLVVGCVKLHQAYTARTGIACHDGKPCETWSRATRSTLEPTWLRMGFVFPPDDRCQATMNKLQLSQPRSSPPRSSPPRSSLHPKPSGRQVPSYNEQIAIKPTQK